MYVVTDPHVDLINGRGLVCRISPSLRFINFHGFINKATINVVSMSRTLINTIFPTANSLESTFVEKLIDV